MATVPTSIRLTRLPVNWNEQPETFRRWWDETMSAIEQALNAILAIPAIEAAVAAANAAAAAANAAADNAQTAADNAQAATDVTSSEQSIVNSYPANYTFPLIDVSSAGLVTIAPHTRIYGNPTLNPNVNIVGGSFPTLASTGDVIYVYYVDATRSNPNPTFIYSLDASDAAQTGDTHSIGNGTIPGAGSQPGNPTLPPGVPPSS